MMPTISSSPDINDLIIAKVKLLVLICSEVYAELRAIDCADAFASNTRSHRFTPLAENLDSLSQ
jgi:hypothetical protein